MVYKFICWILGHKVGGKVIKDGYKNVAGELCPGWKYYCKRCSTKNEYPDRRNLYQRIVPVWFSILRNKLTFRNFH